MNYNKQLFIDNINYLVKYNYEPEITIILKNDKKIFLIAYKEWIDLTLPSDEVIKLSRIEELFNYIDINEVVEIYDDIDHRFPIETQSIIVDNELWIDGELPKDVFKKYKKHFSIYQCIMIVLNMSILIYMIITFWRKDEFDLFSIVYSLFILVIIIFILGTIVFENKRKKIIKKYYGAVSEEDKLTAKKLLEEIDILNNDYDFFNKFHFDEEYSVIKQCLNLIIKGKKIHKSLSNIIFNINNEIKNNNEDNKYSDIKYNKYIEDCCNLIERNNVEI